MLYNCTATKKSRKFEHACLIRNHRYGNSIENSSKKNDDNTLAFPLLILAIEKATSKYLETSNLLGS